MANGNAHGVVRKAYQDEADDPPVRALSFEEAQALRAKNPGVSPWRVVGTQAAVGGVTAVLAGLVTGAAPAFWSALYGTATAVVPGALMARGMTSRFTSLSPAVSGVGVMVWSLVKIGVSVLMLLLAPRLIQPLSWPALLVALVLCVQVYWLALLWRGR
jgi:ATP synthase protein I